MTERLPIQTQHCRFCNHLLLATTRKIDTLPRRTGEGKDKALILPLERNHSADTDADPDTDTPEASLEKEAGNGRKSRASSHTTLLLATTVPDRRATVIRREDGIEKRLLLRCGRCRVVIGYYLDRVHWGSVGNENEQEGEEERPPAVYLLPGAVVGTEKMGGEGVGEGEWREWVV
ncbi:uncharacterized protein N7515_003001 [Penicillium bovifimosum]|uniref:STEEP1 domain-containing protein n=1 Tax=Penicillium bovifimosum TaxID=126998 RepID=A0A9W9HCY4_9EURO|nr:uncharacterized protein N7515_003001 [Penicillium bovifimosum]KAJ5144214.1 hypothetical protein N7515_003001 [Penicillium bovifimosum]